MNTTHEALWLWQSRTWPNLTHDPGRLAVPLARARLEAGRLQGKAETIGLAERSALEREVWSQDAVATAAIEGQALDLGAVRSSVARRLGLAQRGPAAPRDVEGLLDVMENAAHAWQQPLTRERLCAWQAALFPAGSALREILVGAWRSSPEPMQIVSGPHGRETVHFEAVPGPAVGAEMHALLEWFNGTRDAAIDGLVRAGLVHAWFETIHPFDDGNGRVGRAVVDLALAQDAGHSARLHGMAIAMRRRQEAYYDALNAAQRGTGDVTEWLLWFVDTYADACRESAAKIDQSLARVRFWAGHQDVSLNEQQRKAINRMLDAGPGGFTGGLTPRKYVAITGTSKVTASRHIADLLAHRMIRRGPGAGGRSTYYDLALDGWEWRGPNTAVHPAGDPPATED